VVDLDGCRYLVDAGAIWAIRETAEGDIEKTRVSNFVMETRRELTVDDGLRKEKVFEAALRRQGEEEERLIKVPVADFYNAALARHLGSAGSDLDFGKDIAVLRRVCSQISAPVRQHIQQEIGYRGDGMFVMANRIVTADGRILPNENYPVELEEEEHARHLGLLVLDDVAARGIARHLIDDFIHLYNPVIGCTMIGHAGLAPLFGRQLELGNKHALVLWGGSGDSKSLACQAAQCFFGDFIGPGKCQSWRSTINSIERAGYFFRHAVYYVEDFKQQLLGKNYEAGLALIQTYGDERGRGRLARDSHSLPTYFIRGLLLVSGEDIPQGQASTAGRCVYLRVDGRGDLYVGERILEHRRKYSAVMARYLAWLAAADDRVLQVRFRELQRRFMAPIAGCENDMRIAGNTAQNALGFECFASYLLDDGVVSDAERAALLRQHHEGLFAVQDEMAREVKKQAAGAQFLDRLRELLTCEAVRLRRPNEYLPEGKGAPIVGFIDDDEDDVAYVLPAVAFEAIQRHFPHHQIKFSADAIGEQLKKRGALARCEKGRTKVLKRQNGKREWYWAIRVSALGQAVVDLDKEPIERRVANLIALGATPNSPIGQHLPSIEKTFQLLVTLVGQARATHKLSDDLDLQGVVEAVMECAPASSDAAALLAAYKATSGAVAAAGHRPEGGKRARAEEESLTS
jgi:hypothetical protein